MTLKPTPMEVETIFDAACQLFTDKAAACELDVMRHNGFFTSMLGHTGIAPKTRKEALAASKKEAARNARLAEICRQMREHCHERNISALFSSIKF